MKCACWQVVPLLARLALPTDVAVLNWGLHYSPAYREQLLSLTHQVPALLGTHKGLIAHSEC